jgi:hypothetical protein
MGWKIVRHSFVLLFRNLGDALRISVGPYLVALLLMLAIGAAVGVPPAMVFGVGANPQDAAGLISGAGVALFVVATWVILLAVSAWVAVSWHRFVLLEEYPGLLPAWSGRPILPYVLRTLLLIVILVLAMIPLSFVIGLLAFPIVGSADPESSRFAAGILLIALVSSAIIYWLWMRLALILPATAVERDMSLGESWRATAPAAGAILVAIVILAGVSIGASFVLDRLFPGGLVGGVLGLIVTWISLMVGISVMTTLYGHLIERRPLD